MRAIYQNFHFKRTLITGLSQQTLIMISKVVALFCIAPHIVSALPTIVTAIFVALYRSIIIQRERAIKKRSKEPKMKQIRLRLIFLQVRQQQNRYKNISNFWAPLPFHFISLSFFLGFSSPCKETFQSKFLPAIQKSGYIPHVPWPITFQVDRLIDRQIDRLINRQIDCMMNTSKVDRYIHSNSEIKLYSSRTVIDLILGRQIEILID